MSLKDNLEEVRRRIAKAALKVQRAPEEIRLVAVTKTVPVEMIEEAVLAGITDIGENRVQEAEGKEGALRQKYPRVRWHMVGHLQRNKVRHSLDIFDIIQSIDSERLAEAVDAQAGALGKDKVPVLVEVKTSQEAAKYGVPAEAAIGFVSRIAGLKHIKIEGLMTIAPQFDDPDKARPYFETLRGLRDKITALGLPGVEMKYLSMGMTDDFEAAIEEGSNMVRIGRAIFGKRTSS